MNDNQTYTIALGSAFGTSIGVVIGCVARIIIALLIFKEDKNS